MAKEKKSNLKERMKSEGFGRIDESGKTYEKPIVEVEYITEEEYVKEKNKK